MPIPTVGGEAMARGLPAGMQDEVKEYVDACETGVGGEVGVRGGLAGIGISLCSDSTPYDGPLSCGDMYNPVPCVAWTCETYCVWIEIFGHSYRVCNEHCYAQ